MIWSKRLHAHVQVAIDKRWHNIPLIIICCWRLIWIFFSTKLRCCYHSMLLALPLVWLNDVTFFFCFSLSFNVFPKIVNHKCSNLKYQLMLIVDCWCIPTYLHFKLNVIIFFNAFFFFYFWSSTHFVDFVEYHVKLVVFPCELPIYIRKTTILMKTTNLIYLIVMIWM